jgi:hypothetical protein
VTRPKVNWSERDQKYWVLGTGEYGDEVLWFESVLDAGAAARQVEIDTAVKAREALIMKWLRKHGMRQTAMMLKKGEHLK